MLSLKIITPVRVAYEDNEISGVTVPTSGGQITILDHHIPLVTKVAMGELVIKKGNEEKILVVTDGFLKLDKSGYITILSDYAIRSDEIETAKVEEAKKKAEEAMKEKTSQRDFAIAEAELRRTLLELKVAQKSHSSSHRI